MESAAQNTKKTGLAGRMREWMAARAGNKRQRRFTACQISDALEIPHGEPRQSVHNVLWDFLSRGELTYVKDRLKHPYKTLLEERYFLYVHDWRKVLRGSLNRKIFKAMYVSGAFAATDIQRLTGLDRAWIDKLIIRLRKEGHIQIIRRRRCAHGAGAENIYHVINRDRFKLEVMR